MKTPVAIMTALVLAGCVNQRHVVFTHNLIEEGFIQTTPSRDLFIDAAGHPITTVPTNQVMSKWQIHPDAPLDKVARFTGAFRENERIELWTATGIYLVMAPCYGGRRLPWFGATDAEYRVSSDWHIVRDRHPWCTANNAKEAADRIFTDLRHRSKLGFVNLYVDFLPTDTWSDAEGVIATFLPRLDAMRGLWLGMDNTNRVTLHLHDVWRKEWRSPNQAPEGTARKLAVPQR